MVFKSFLLTFCKERLEGALVCGGYRTDETGPALFSNLWRQSMQMKVTTSLHLEIIYFMASKEISALSCDNSDDIGGFHTILTSELNWSESQSAWAKIKKKSI